MDDTPKTGKQAIDSNVNGKRMADRVGADFARELERENIRLRKALQSVLRYRRGQGEYDFSCEPEETRSNAAFDAWMQIEDHIISLLPNVKDEPWREVARDVRKHGA
jgi:hypothetical protein